jgi:hypothetical protein
MIRAYAIGLGAGTQVLTHLPWFLLVDLKPGYLPRAVMMGLGWIINITVAENVIRKGVGKGVLEGVGKGVLDGVFDGVREGVFNRGSAVRV